MLYIYAGEYRQAAWLGEWLGLDRHSWEFLGDNRSLNGIQSPKVIRWGTYRNRRDYQYTMDMLSALGAFVIDVNDDLMRFAYHS